MEDEQPRTSNSSRESGSEFANSVTSTTSVGSVSGKVSIANSATGSETAESAPIETTSGSMQGICATQACAQPTDIVKLAEATLQNLKVLWEEIGFADHECDNATAEMFAEVKRVFENKLSSTQEVKCQLTSQIRLANARICTIGTELGESAAVESFKSSEETDAPNLRAVLAASKAFLDDLEARKAERTAVLTQKGEELSALFMELDGALSAEQAKFLKVVSDFTLGRIEQFEGRIKELQQHKAARLDAVRGTMDEIRGLWAELCWAPDTFQAGSIDARIHAGEVWRLTPAGTAELEERVGQLREEKENRTSNKDRAMRELQDLWEITKTEQDAVASFRAAHETLSVQCLEEIKAEIQRLQAVKKAMMKELVLEKREELKGVWEAMRLPEEKRQELEQTDAEGFTEECLQQLEEELERSQALLAAMQPLLKIIDRRTLIRAEEAAMKEAQGDPSRLLGRGRGMAERLKQEEKIRNMVTKEMPKLNEKLKAALVEFKQTQGRDLEVDGIVYEGVLREEMEAMSASKGRKGASTNKSGPPSSASSKTPAQTPRESKDKDKEGAEHSAKAATSTPGSALAKFRTASKALARVPMASLDSNSVNGKRQAEGDAEDGSSTARSAAKSPRHALQQTAPVRGTGHLKRTITPKQ